MTEFDCIIVGQGLAGTALAWSLRWSGVRVLVIDRDEPITSSKIAAGLITPITGQRLVKSWRLDELWPAAVQFYRRVEQATGTALFRERSMVRLLATDGEAEFLQLRRQSLEFLALIREPQPPLDSRAFATERGGFEMPCAGQLDVPQYLNVSRETFLCDGGFVTVSLDPERDLVLNDNRVSIPRLGVHARRLIFCEGAALTSNPWFRGVVLKPAKGEILTVRIPGLTEERVVHRGVWLAPLGTVTQQLPEFPSCSLPSAGRVREGGRVANQLDLPPPSPALPAEGREESRGKREVVSHRILGNELFRVGSTYEWQQLDNRPTSQGRDEITAKLREFLRLPFEVLEHQAAVRPIHRNQYPVLGLHPEHNQLGYFNGLGSKGTLHAPYFASQLTRQLGGRPDATAD